MARSQQKRYPIACGKLKKDGLAKAVSVSTHDPEVVKIAAQTESVDSVMYQVNVANHAYKAAKDALKYCQQCGVGVVAMKPFAGGELLKAGKTVKIAEYKTGWKPITLTVPNYTAPAMLLSYVLDQPSVCTVVVGVSSTQQLTANLTYLELSKKKEIILTC